MAHMRKAGPFVTNGEERTAAELAKLPPDWIVICNKILYVNDRDYELDFIIIADKLIFLLEEKSWHGTITGNDQQWKLTDRSARNPLNKVKYEAKLLADNIRRVIPELQPVRYFVSAGVVLSSARTMPQLTNGSWMLESIFLLTDVCQRLTALDRSHKGPDITRLRPQISACLYGLPARPETPAHINQIYKIEDATYVRQGVRLFRASLLEDGEPRNLMLYDVSKEPATSREELRLHYLREFKALQELRKTGYVPEVKDPFTWSDDFLVLPIVPPEGNRLLDYPFPTSGPELIDELYMAAEAFKALGTFHQHGVIHRAIDPEAIYIRQHSAPFGLIFTNFFAARTGNKSIRTYLDALRKDDPYFDPYIAPELSAGYGLARPSTDVFSLALVFLERWSGQSLNELRPKMNESVILPDLSARWPSLPAGGIARLNELFRSIFTYQANTHRPAAFDVARQLEEIARSLAT